MFKYLTDRLQGGLPIVDVVSILSTLLLCVEISKTLRVRVPVSCVAPLKDFMKDCGGEEKGSFVDEEKFKETLSGGEEDSAKSVIQFVLDVVKEIQGSVDQLGRPNTTQKKKKGTKRAPKLEVIEEEEEEMELGEEEESSEEVGGSEELSIREESGHENDSKEESGHKESGHEENHKEESDNKASDHDKTNTHEEPQQDDNPTSPPHENQQKNDDSPPTPIESPTETTLPHPVDSESDSFYDEPEYCHCLFPKLSLCLVHTFDGSGKSLWERGRRLGGNDNPYQK